MWEASERALAAGCDDPLVRLVRKSARWSLFILSLEEGDVESTKLRQGILEGDFHLVHRLLALCLDIRFRRAVEQSGEPDWEALAVDGREVLRLLSEIAADPVPRRVMAYVVQEAILGLRSAGARDPHQLIVDVLDQFSQDRCYVLVEQARQKLNAALGQRGNRPAERLAPEALAEFNRALVEVEHLLRQAYELDPSYAPASESMIDVVRYRENSRHLVQLWYDRAMEADPFSRAPMFVLEALHPINGGSDAEQIAWGLECLDSGDFHTIRPSVLLRAHERVRYRAYATTHAYYSDPEVWQTVRAVYEGYLREFPDSIYHRSQYAVMAAEGGHWEEVHRQCSILGERFSIRLLGPREYRELRQAAARETGTVLEDLDDAISAPWPTEKLPVQTWWMQYAHIDQPDSIWGIRQQVAYRFDHATGRWQRMRSSSGDVAIIRHALPGGGAFVVLRSLGDGPGQFYTGGRWYTGQPDQLANHPALRELILGRWNGPHWIYMHPDGGFWNFRGGPDRVDADGRLTSVRELPELIRLLPENAQFIVSAMGVLDGGRSLVVRISISNRRELDPGGRRIPRLPAAYILTHAGDDWTIRPILAEGDKPFYVNERYLHHAPDGSIWSAIQIDRSSHLMMLNEREMVLVAPRVFPRLVDRHGNVWCSAPESHIRIYMAERQIETAMPFSIETLLEAPDGRIWHLDGERATELRLENDQVQIIQKFTFPTSQEWRQAMIDVEGDLWLLIDTERIRRIALPPALAGDSQGQ